MNIFTKLTKIRKLACYLSLFIMLIASMAVGGKGVNMGLDFTGGYLIEFSSKQAISQQVMQDSLNEMFAANIRVNGAQQGTRWTLRAQEEMMHEFSDATSEGLGLQALSESLGTELTLLDSNYISSQVGEQMIEKGSVAMLVAALMVMLYVALRFEWRLALGALVALVHDVLIVLIFFIMFDFVFDLTVLAALLAIIGYSLNDSIVIGDRIRELLMQRASVVAAKPDINEDIKDAMLLNNIVDLAIKSTLMRTAITSGTTLITVACLCLLAGKPLFGFSVALFVGVLAGTLSSISIAATLPIILGLKFDYYLDKIKLRNDIAQEKLR
jgi:preprotein translocase subunit SecF